MRIQTNLKCVNDAYTEDKSSHLLIICFVEY